MTSMLCQSATLDRFIAPWAARIVEFWIAVVETILTIAKTVRTPWPIAGKGPAAPGAALGAVTLHDGEERDMRLPCCPECHPCPCTSSARCVLLNDIGAASAGIAGSRRLEESGACDGTVCT